MIPKLGRADLGPDVRAHGGRPDSDTGNRRHPDPVRDGSDSFRKSFPVGTEKPTRPPRDHV